MDSSMRQVGKPLVILAVLAVLHGEDRPYLLNLGAAADMKPAAFSTYECTALLH
jgi:hypothetical protein